MAKNQGYTEKVKKKAQVYASKYVPTSEYGGY